MAIYDYVPHPRIAERKAGTPAVVAEQLPTATPAGRFNSWLAVKITAVVGTMWCAYAFAGLALVSLPYAIAHGTATLIQWIAQTFLQLVLLSIIIVGQNIQSAASDKRAADTYSDAEAILHEARQIQAHLQAQDEAIEWILTQVKAQAGDVTPPAPDGSPT